jgi:hypothetical protein
MASDFLRIVFGFAYFVLTGVEEPGAVSLLFCIFFGVPSIPKASFYYKSIDNEEPWG